MASTELSAPMIRMMSKLILTCIQIALAASLSGCASYGVIENQPLSTADDSTAYSVVTLAKRKTNDRTIFLVSFSGGGTRAAALAYGVLKELRSTPVQEPGLPPIRMLDKIDMISSVSGGSFTAAYYGLHGEKTFEDFESVFLRRNIQGSLIRSVLNPFHWFSSTGRTELAVQHYEDVIFKGATFADLLKNRGPMIMISASDLAYGARFSFTQEFFNLLCSDLSSFPVSRAVAASSAVPFLFNPVVVRNYPDCDIKATAWLKKLKARSVDNLEVTMAIRGLESYFEKEKRQFAHLVDGGITDNLGLRAIYDMVALSGGPSRLLQRLDEEPPRRIVLLSVNAATVPEPQMDRSSKQPSLTEAANAMADVQIHRYNIATEALMRRSLVHWAQELSTPENTVEPYFIDLSIQAVQSLPTLRLLNLTPTSFSLSDKQIDRLLDTGGSLLREHPEYQRLLGDLQSRQP